jgi:hypothetical protein
MNNPEPFYRRPRSQAILVLVLGLALYAYLTYRVDGLQIRLLPLTVDVILLVGGGLVWMAFFSQFVLPVRSLQERWMAFNRLRNYLTGNHGPAIFIENGEVKHRSQELRRRGVGVIVLDTGSAAVLRNASAFTRAIGPGIVFTDQKEYIAGTVDLHSQMRQIGPIEKDTDPFAPQQKDESREAYQRREERRWETSGLTRDGVEVIPVIAATFRLDSKPGEGGTMFGYNPKAVWRTIASEGIDPDAPVDARSRRVPWNWLPVYLAADLWREYLRKFTLNELFTQPPSRTSLEPVDPRKTVFEWVESLVFRRLTQPEVENLNEIGRPTGQMIASREYEILQKRGIRMKDISISNLHFPASVEKELVRQWKANWLDRAQQETELVDRVRSYEKLVGEERALLDYADAASQFLGPIVIENANMPELLPDILDSLELLVRGTLNQTIRDPQLHPKIKTEKTHLVEVIEWIRRQ